MPNWCSNRMYFSGEPAQIAEIKRLASGAVTPLYRRAINEGIQLFLTGSAGLLRITENIRSEQCPGVTAAGLGAVTVSPVTSPKFLLRPRAPCRCWDVPQVLRLSRKRGNSSAVSLSRNHRRRPVRKKEAQKRKAVDVRPRSRSLSRRLNKKRVRRGVNVDISGTHPAFSSLWFSAPIIF